MKKLNLLAALIAIVSSVSLYGQTSQKKIIVPIVKLEGSSFTDNIEQAFRCPAEYMEIDVWGRDTTYRVHSYNHIYPDSISSGDNELQQRLNLPYKVNDFKYLPFIDHSVFFKGDSVFFVYMDGYKNVRSMFFPNYSIYGCKRGGEYYYSTTKQHQPLMSLGEVLTQEYGSLENFEKAFIDLKRQEIRMDMTRELELPNTIAGLTAFIKKDYAYYETLNPGENKEILDRFVEFVNQQTGLDENQKKELYSQMSKLVDNNKKEGKKEYHPSSSLFTGILARRCVVCQTDAMPVIENILSSQQWNRFKDLNERYNAKRQEALLMLKKAFYPHLCSDNRQKGEIEKNLSLIADYIVKHKL